MAWMERRRRVFVIDLSIDRGLSADAAAIADRLADIA